MKILKLLAPGAIVVALALGGRAATAQQSGSANAPSPGIGGQGEEGSTLEIAPQPGARLPRPSVEEIPGGKNYQPGEDTESINQSYKPGLENGLRNQSNRRPCLGIRVQYATQCYLGKEEQGLLVTEVDPGGPAEHAGVHPQPSVGPARVALGTMAALVGPLGLVVDKALEQPGGDLIVAVDDRRIRSQMDLDDALARLKPGDTMYLTVIRPLDTHGNHQTLKIRVQLGAVEGAGVSAGAPPGSCGATDFTHYSLSGTHIPQSTGN
jgi:hypothetical protein